MELRNGSLLALGAAALMASTGAKAEKMTGLLHNEDCTNFFYAQKFPPGEAGEITDRYVDVLAGAGVTVLFCNTNARRTNYRSDVWEAFWDGYDPDGLDDQPFLAAAPEDGRKRFRQLVHNMLEVHRQGVDYPARVIERCRRHGISPWISLRMNDVHYNDDLEHPFHSALWRRPELFRKGHPGYYARALDYAHKEVRDKYKALVVETLERYDLDGLELDFMREPYLFSKGREQEGREILTAWMREIGSLVAAAATRLGRPVKLGVRAPSDPEVALGLGLDAPTWAREGLIDLVVATPRWSTLHYDIPLRDWRKLLGDRVTLAGGLEVRCQPYPGGPVRNMVPEDAIGAAVSVLSRGGDVVYLFNYFQHCRWPRAEYQRVLKTMSSLDELLKQPRRHVVTFRQVAVPGKVCRVPLPATGRTLSFDLPLGPKPGAGWQAELQLGLAVEKTAPESPAASVNGVQCGLRNSEKLEDGSLLLTYSVPLDALPGRNSDVISVKAVGQSPVKVLRVEVRFAQSD